MVTEYEDCLSSDVCVGSFRSMRNRLNIIWVQCPLSALLRFQKKVRLILGSRLRASS